MWKSRCKESGSRKEAERQGMVKEQESEFLISKVGRSFNLISEKIQEET